MEQPFSTSKVTVEYFDPHGVYKLIAPGLIPRLPLRNLHWQSHAGPLRSIATLHIELVPSGADPASVASLSQPPNLLRRPVSGSAKDDGFQTQNLGGKSASAENVESQIAVARQPSKERRHQIPGLRRTPYLKVLLVRCDDSETYKSQTRSEIRDWIKSNTPPSQSTKKVNTQENHDAFEWMVVHVVIPNTVAANQPRISGKSSEGSTSDKGSSRWRSGSSTLLEKLRSDFNSTSKGSVDRIAQIRIGINDVPYDVLPRVVPATPTGYTETEQDAENAWQDLIGKVKGLILSSFDMRVGQYEDDIKEKDAQRALPGWNFCTFFILKEGLARGFESVGLVEDALVGYDELSVGLDSIIQEQAIAGDPERHGGALLSHTEDLRSCAEKAVAAIAAGNGDFLEDEESVDLQSKDTRGSESFGEIPISSSKKPYREMILANNVSVYDFRCYIFARQISLLLRLGNAWSTREELLAKLQEQQESVLHGVAPRAPPPKQSEESENLTMLAEICRRALEFIPAVSQVMRSDIIAATVESNQTGENGRVLDPILSDVVDNLVASFAFSVAQQILAQTSTKALPIPPSTLAPLDGHEPKASIPEPKTMMHPARSSSLHVRPNSQPPPSPGDFPRPGRRASVPEGDATFSSSQFLKAGLEELAAKRAELYTLYRSVLEESGKKRGWSDGWGAIPLVGDSNIIGMEDISLDDDPPNIAKPANPSMAGIGNNLLRAALDNKEDFYRLYETLTDKALRHYTVANHTHSMHANMTDLAVLKFHLGDYSAAAAFFYGTTPFYGESGWSLLELSMLVMYSRCLRELQWKEDYVRVVLKLLTKACAAEKQRLRLKAAVQIATQPKLEFPEKSAIKGFLEDLLGATRTLSNEVRIPLGKFFTDVGLDGTPTYFNKRDGYSLAVKLRSLLVDEMNVDKVRMRMSSSAFGSTRELWLESTEAVVLKPGTNVLHLTSNTIVAGVYRIDQLSLTSNNVHVHFERDVSQSMSQTTDIFRNADVTIFRRQGGFDARLTATKHTQLDRNSSLDLELNAGWNSITSCEIRVKPETGGLRLLTTEAKFIGLSLEYSKTPEAGVFYFNEIQPEAVIKLQFPFSTEQDMPSISVRVDVKFTTADGTYSLSTTSTVTISLALGVNVQDIFKHSSLFSRFSVSTAGTSPLRIFKSELLGSDPFDSHFGVSPSTPVLIFPKQPASMLYKITRKPGVLIEPKVQKTLYLKLHYSVLQDEIADLVEKSLTQALEASPLRIYSLLIVGHVLLEAALRLSAYDLERAALLGEIPTSFVADFKWERAFAGVGTIPGTNEDATAAIVSFLDAWMRANPKLAILQTASGQEQKSILIPVDVPSIPVLHTADICLQTSLPSPLQYKKRDTPTVSVNQLLPATLHLRWTRIWDTAIPDKKSQPTPQQLEFSYEVSAPPDTWLLGGRRRGHFVIPSDKDSVTSTPESEADIPLVLVPLREGWLPYPSVEIREVRGEEEVAASPTQGHCETDYRNLGETVRVVADRARATLSLDASGPGGGPLVLESERRRLEGRVVV